MKFEIRKVETDSLIVDYEDGAWAIIPITKDEPKASIESKILEFMTPYTKPTPWDKVEDVPFKVGDKGDSDDLSAQEDTGDMFIKQYKYNEAREINYPSAKSQFDALYWSRNGDTSLLTAIDAKIKKTKEDFPKDDEGKRWSWAEVNPDRTS